jgi:hypothetical protein
LVGTVSQKEVTEEKEDEIIQEQTNELYEAFCSKNRFQLFHSFRNIEYSAKSLLKTYTSISRNSSNIGVAANAEMIRSAIGIENMDEFELLNACFSWNLERIIDSTVKDGIASDEDMEAIREMYNYVIENNIELPKSIVHRMPTKLQEEVVIKEEHLLDQLLDAIKLLIDKADKEIVGRGSVKKGNRIEGWIDRLDIPVMELGLLNLGNRMNKEAVILYKGYNKEVAILLERTNKLSYADRMTVLKDRILEIQEKFLLTLGCYSEEERRSIVLSIAYEIYKTNSAVHDSILWINGTKGTASVMIDVLLEIGEAYRIKRNGKVTREFIDPAERVISEVRLWTKEKLNLSELSKINEVLIENRTILVGDTLLNLGDECRLSDGIYSLLSLAPSFSSSKNAYLSSSFCAIVC